MPLLLPKTGVKSGRGKRMFAVQTTKSSDFLRIRGSVKISETYDSRIFELNFGLKIAIWAKRNHGGESKAISPP
jgi:hypothetical protein